ncbi:MAG: type II toxin-antitoxin system Phd/YefM family antitoxin, partial [Firmicutes bacterium]|nr:type II toxin-antitoxin system Phd/YefM family antitoxin [Bacillota bacterium]
MTTESITRARANLYNLVEQVNADGEPVILTNNRGKNAVLIAEDVWRSIQETLYLASV